MLFQTNRFSFHAIEEKKDLISSLYIIMLVKKLCVFWQGFQNKTYFTFDNINVWQTGKKFSCDAFGLLELHRTKIVYVSATTHPLEREMLGTLNFLLFFFFFKYILCI